MAESNGWNGHASTDSGSDDTEVFDAVIIPEVEDGSAADWFGQPVTPPDDARELTGNVVSSGRSAKSEKVDPLDRDASTGIPKITEWEHFFGNILLRLATDFYIDMAFRDIDESLLSDREIDRIKLDKNERLRIARPFAEYSNKSKFMRKHGRMIIASGDSIDAVIQLGMWISRVNRVAGAVRRRQGGSVKMTRAAPLFRPGAHHARPEAPRMQEPIPHAPQAGEDDSVSFGSGEKPPATVRPAGWRPDIAGQVFNPGG